MKGVFLVLLGFFSLVFSGDVFSSEIMIRVEGGKAIIAPYCWKQGDEVRFEAPGGSFGIPLKDIKLIEERVIHSEHDNEYLKSKATKPIQGDVKGILQGALKDRKGIDIELCDKTSTEEKTKRAKGSVEIISPFTDLYDFFELPFKKSDGEVVLVVAFVNARGDMKERKCVVKLLDIDGNEVAKRDLSIQRFCLDPEQQRAHKISSFFYALYGYIPLDLSFVSYNVVCDIGKP